MAPGSDERDPPVAVGARTNERSAWLARQASGADITIGTPAGPGVGSGAARFRAGITLLSPLARVPIALEETLRHLALEFIREPPAGANEEAGDVAIGLLLMRLKNRVQYAPQQAGLAHRAGAPPAAFLAEASTRSWEMSRVTHMPSPSVFPE